MHVADISHMSAFSQRRRRESNRWTWDYETDAMRARLRTDGCKESLNFRVLIEKAGGPLINGIKGRWFIETYFHNILTNSALYHLYQGVPLQLCLWHAPGENSKFFLRRVPIFCWLAFLCLNHAQMIVGKSIEMQSLKSSIQSHLE